MPKVRPERISGIVAMSYLVLIPVGAVIAWRKIQAIDEDLTTVWEGEHINQERATNPFGNLGRLFGGITRNG